jgi:hypothetical protein
VSNYYWPVNHEIMDLSINSSNIARYHLFSRNWGLLLLIAGLIMADTALGEDRLVQFTAATPVTDQTSQLTPLQLEELVGSIALYPDDLISILLPAATQPLQVVQAVRYLDQHASDPDLNPDPEWDESIIALLNYPEVLRLMDGNLDWTVQLGQAVITQQQQLMDAIQQFRRRANAAGNLTSDARQRVVKEGDTIEIRPADPEVIYVPYYEPQQVIVRRYAPLYDYSPVAYPVYYYPYTPDYRFSTGFFWGVTTAFVINWNTHYIHSYRSNNFRHPYYGSNYYTNRFLYRDWRDQRRAYRGSRATSGRVWQPNYNRGNRTAIVTGSLPLRQSVQAGRIQDNQQFRHNSRSATGGIPGSAAPASGNFDTNRQQYFRSRNADRRSGVDSRATATWRSDRSTATQRDRYINARSVTRTVASTAAPATRQTDSDNNNNQHQSRPALRRNNSSDNTDARLQLRANPVSSFTSQSKRSRFFRR